jgi:hypothetical protein
MRAGHMAIGLAAVVGVVPASFAHDVRVLDHGKRAGTGSNTGISLVAPIGTVSVDPEFLDGEPVFVRRTTAGEGMTVVEVSTTPFMLEGSPGAGGSMGRPDQPASW